MGMGRFSSVKTRKLLKELTEWMANKKLVIEFDETLTFHVWKNLSWMLVKGGLKVLIYLKIKYMTHIVVLRCLLFLMRRRTTNETDMSILL